MTISQLFGHPQNGTVPESRPRVGKRSPEVRALRRKLASSGNPHVILVTSAGKVAFGKFTEITGAQWSGPRFFGIG